MMMPPPDAWTTRPSSSTEKTGARAQITVPIVNSPIAAKNSDRVVNFWIRNAVIGIMIPLTSMKIVVTHCAEFAVMSKSRMNSGNAVFSNVWFRMTMNAPETSVASTTFRLNGAGFPLSVVT